MSILLVKQPQSIVVVERPQNVSAAVQMIRLVAKDEQLPALLALALQAQPLSAYWLAPNIFVAISAAAVGWICAACLALLAALLLIRKRWRFAAILALGLGAFAFFPYDALNMRLDFLLRVERMSAIAEAAQHDPPPFQHAPGNMEGVWLLPREQAALAQRGEFYTEPTSCGALVFFPTFLGMPDGVGGFLFVPECATLEQFPHMFGEGQRTYAQVSARWWRLDGT